jgi:superfamily II DNA or RNA helicase
MARVSNESVRPDTWDVVVVDEFHHAEASFLRAMLAYLRPGFFSA